MRSKDSNTAGGAEGWRAGAGGEQGHAAAMRRGPAEWSGPAESKTLGTGQGEGGGGGTESKKKRLRGRRGFGLVSLR
jgi:hypothetical protein